MNDKQFEAVTSFKYLGATLCKNDTSSAEVGNRTASAMTRLNSIKWCNTISFASKLKLYKSLVTFILLYGCEAWTLLADSEEKDPGFRSQVHKELLRISYLEHKTNHWVQSKINFIVGMYFWIEIFT